MPKRSSNADPNLAAFRVVAEATVEKNPNAVALGRLGGLVGGTARAKKLSAKRKSEIARMGAMARIKTLKKRSAARPSGSTQGDQKTSQP